MAQSWILISYGDFAKTKKLFSYDRFGVHTLPLFEDIMTATDFLKSLTKVYGKKKAFQLCCCENKKGLIEILELVTIASFDLENIIIDPEFNQPKNLERFNICEKVTKISDYLDKLKEETP